MIHPVKWNKFYPHNKVVKSFIQGTSERNRSWWKNETKRYIKQKKGNFFKIVLSDHIDRGVWFTCWTGLSVHCPHGLFDREPLGGTLVSSLSPFARCSLASSPISIIARLLEPFTVFLPARELYVLFFQLSSSGRFFIRYLFHAASRPFALYHNLCSQGRKNSICLEQSCFSSMHILCPTAAIPGSSNLRFSEVGLSCLNHSDRTY